MFALMIPDLNLTIKNEYTYNNTNALLINTINCMNIHCPTSKYIYMLIILNLIRVTYL